MAILDSRYNSYPAYKPSEVEWLGEIPAHWEVKRLKHVGKLQGGAGFPHQEQWDTTQEFPFFKVGDMAMDANQREMVEYQHTVSGDTANRLGAYIFPTTTIVFAKVGAALLLNRRRMIVRPSCIDNNMMGFIPRGPAHDWMMYWLSGLDLGKLANPGAVPSVNEGQMREQEAVLPPLSEQRTIAAFLDRETARIDALVAKKERLIELLQEKRTALITRAVTRGLDLNVPVRDSGVEWLGEIPAHWDVKRLKVISEIRYGLGQPPKELSDGLPLIRATNVYRGHLADADMLYVDPEDVPVGRRAFLSAGEIVVVRSGAYTADSAIITKKFDGAIAGYDMVVTVKKAEPEFIAVALLCPYIRDAQLVVASTRSAQPHLNAEELGDALILLPPLSEQHAIAAFLEGEIAKVDSLVAKVQEAIERLRELRSSLISAAVTGQIDVRQEAGCK